MAKYLNESQDSKCRLFCREIAFVAFSTLFIKQQMSAFYPLGRGVRADIFLQEGFPKYSGEEKHYFVIWIDQESILEGRTSGKGIDTDLLTQLTCVKVFLSDAQPGWLEKGQDPGAGRWIFSDFFWD